MNLLFILFIFFLSLLQFVDLSESIECENCPAISFQLNRNEEIEKSQIKLKRATAIYPE